MTRASSLNGPRQRQLFPKRAAAKPDERMSGDLLVMAALIGISRALFGPRKQGPAGGTVAALRDTIAEGRGREANKPREIPVKGWKDIAWAIYENIQNDRVLLIAAGVTFYALLALFPATAALVSLYGLFADTSTINEHLRLVSGFLPEGAIEIIGDQVKRIASQGQGTLSTAFLGTLAFSLWGANAGTKAIFDALNIIYKRARRAQLHQADTLVAGVYPGRDPAHPAGVRWHSGGSGRAQASRHCQRIENGVAHRVALAAIVLRHLVRTGLPLQVWPQPEGAAVALGDVGQRHRRRNLARSARCCSPGTWPTSEATTPLTGRLAPPSALWCGFGSQPSLCCWVLRSTRRLSIRPREPMRAYLDGEIREARA